MDRLLVEQHGGYEDHAGHNPLIQDFDVFEVHAVPGDSDREGTGEGTEQFLRSTGTMKLQMHAP